jgi:predicted DNA-binding WGR domain protein
VAENQDVQSDPVADQIAEALVARGFVVDRAVGQSHFRCDLTVRCEGDTEYRLAILLDNDGYYDQSDLLERDLMRPKLLRDFGWKVTFVLAKDWYEDRNGVLDCLSRLLAGDEEPTEDEEQADEGNLEVADTEQHQAAIVEMDGNSSSTLTRAFETTMESSEAIPSERSSVGEEPIANAPPPADTTAADNSTRRFVFTGGNSNKFWEIAIAGAQHTVRFGRIGSKGQSVTKTFENTASARRDCERLIRSKKAKGYREIP